MAASAEDRLLLSKAGLGDRGGVASEQPKQSELVASPQTVLPDRPELGGSLPCSDIFLITTKFSAPGPRVALKEEQGWICSLLFLIR